MRFSIGCLAVIGFSAPMHANGTDDRSVSYVYYDVAGESAEDLSATMNRIGPIDVDGKRHHGLTKWNLTWKDTYEAADGSCRLTSFNVALEITIMLPRWAGYDRGSRRLKAAWDKYVAALRIHENGHRDIDQAAADAIEKELGAITARSTCAELQTLIDTTAGGLTDRAHLQNRQYDEATDHGRTQGATLQ
jgi:predicted secreted Zn-dependent protease